MNVLYKCIFTAAMESKIIDENPTIYLKKNVGGIPQKDRLPLTDEQVDKLLDAIYGLPPYVFVMLGLYAGLRREEILGLQWIRCILIARLRTLPFGEPGIRSIIVR